MMGPGLGDWTGPQALGFRRQDRTIDWEQFERLGRRWKWWDARYGLWFRLAHGCEHQLDLLKLHRLLTGRPTPFPDVARTTLDENRALVDQLIAEREPIRDPPGLELVRGG